MKGHCILSHGFESGPHATKVTALAEVAGRLGFSYECPDYTDLDRQQDKGAHGDVPARVARLLGLVQAAATRGPVVLAGSSLGAYISGYVSQQVAVAGLFLMAPPVAMRAAPPMPAADVPMSIIHGWQDELIPAQQVVDWAAPRKARLLLVNDGHRLSEHVQASAEAFAALLESL
jgi:alpha/beta superfamily hydrolase